MAYTYIGCETFEKNMEKLTKEAKVQALGTTLIVACKSGKTYDLSEFPRDQDGKVRLQADLDIVGMMLVRRVSSVSRNSFAASIMEDEKESETETEVDLASIKPPSQATVSQPSHTAITHAEEQKVLKVIER